MLQVIDQFQAHIETTHSAFIKKTFSLADFVKDTNRVLHEGDQAFHVIPDDPRLTARVPEADIAPVLRVVLDRRLCTPADAHLLDGGAPTLFFHAADVAPDVRFSQVECEPLPEDEGGLSLIAALERLAAREINEVQVEAGPTLAGALFAQGLVDELLLYIAPVLLGSDAHALLTLPPLTDMADRWRLRTVDERRVGEDVAGGVFEAGHAQRVGAHRQARGEHELRAEPLQLDFTPIGCAVNTQIQCQVDAAEGQARDAWHTSNVAHGFDTTRRFDDRQHILVDRLDHRADGFDALGLGQHDGCHAGMAAQLDVLVEPR